MEFAGDQSGATEIAGEADLLDVARDPADGFCPAGSVDAEKRLGPIGILDSEENRAVRHPERPRVIIDAVGGPP
jgi:hypothetical protein